MCKDNIVSTFSTLGRYASPTAVWRSVKRSRFASCFFFFILGFDSSATFSRTNNLTCLSFFIFYYHWSAITIRAQQVYYMCISSLASNENILFSFNFPTQNTYFNSARLPSLIPSVYSLNRHTAFNLLSAFRTNAQYYNKRTPLVIAPLLINFYYYPTRTLLISLTDNGK